jgi:hypothetical protein
VKRIFTLLVVVMILTGHYQPILAEDATEEIKFGAPAKSDEKKSKGSDGISFTDIFGSELALNVSLADVMILVVLVNLFALFRKPRLILAVSYLLCLKWVFWSNYTHLLKHSDALAQASTVVFVICGILTTILFCLDRFNSGD